MYRSQIGCKHAPQTPDIVDVDDDVVLELPVEVIVGDLWWVSFGDDTFIFPTWFVCNIGVGFICVIMFELSTIPDEIDALPFELFSFNSCDVCCGCCCAVEHFISMGTKAGVRYVNREEK